jgi:broad specificity phosphatase PhoE
LGKILICNTGPILREQYGSNPSLGELANHQGVKGWAAAINGRLSEYDMKAVYACPVPGAEEMAWIIASGIGLDPTGLPGLSGEKSPHWRGMEPQDSAIMDCAFNEAGPEVMVSLPFEEDISELRVRVAQAIDDIAVQHKKEAIVIVSHRALSVIMILHMLHLDNRHYRQVAQDYGALNLFEVRFGVPSALYINDTCHLQGLI